MFGVFLIFIATVTSAGFTAGLIHFAPRWGLVDAPDGHRKLQRHAIPLGGGLAVASGCILGGLALVWGPADIARELQAEWPFWLALAAASAIMLAVGLLDDLFDIRGRHKLVAQLVAIGVVVTTGLSVERLMLFGWSWNIGSLSPVLTAAWLVGAINAFNLIDGLDGLAGTIGGIITAAIGAVALVSGQNLEASVCVLILGSQLGFLIFNWHPARIYLGDAGSMLLGLLLGAMSLRVSFVEDHALAGMVPTTIWAVLFFDVIIAILRRCLTGQSVFATDRAHIHHVLRRHGYSIPTVVGLIGTGCAVCCAGAVAAVWSGWDAVACGAVGLVLTTAVASGLFGRSEVVLWSRWAHRFLASWTRLSHRPLNSPEPMISRFHGQCSWEHLWSELVEYSERFDLSSVQLNVSAPVIGEEYHALWTRKDIGNPRTLWRTEIPLFVGELAVGRLTVCGRLLPGTPIESMSELVNGLKPFQVQMEGIIQYSLAESSNADVSSARERRDVAISGLLETPEETAGQIIAVGAKLP